MAKFYLVIRWIVDVMFRQRSGVVTVVEKCDVNTDALLF